MRPSPRLVSRRFALVVLTVGTLFGEVFRVRRQPRAAAGSELRQPHVLHTVFFKYKEDISRDERNEIVRRFLMMKTAAKRQGAPYIISINYGKQVSLEGNDKGFQDGFIVRFRSISDRDYYVGEPVIPAPELFDPVHADFKKWVAPYLEDVFVFDMRVPCVSNELRRSPENG